MNELIKKTLDELKQSSLVFFYRDNQIIVAIYNTIDIQFNSE